LYPLKGHVTGVVDPEAVEFPDWVDDVPVFEGNFAIFPPIFSSNTSTIFCSASGNKYDRHALRLKLTNLKKAFARNTKLVVDKKLDMKSDLSGFTVAGTDVELRKGDFIFIANGDVKEDTETFENAYCARLDKLFAATADSGIGELLT
jgi:hypothetical protein